LIDGGFAPTGAVDADAHLPWKRPLLDLPIERGAGETGAGEHGLMDDLGAAAAESALILAAFS